MITYLSKRSSKKGTVNPNCPTSSKFSGHHRFNLKVKMTHLHKPGIQRTWSVLIEAIQVHRTSSHRLLQQHLGPSKQDSNKKRLERVQSCATRVVTNSWSQDAHILKSQLKWPSLRSHRLFQKICLCRRILRGASITPLSFYKQHLRPSSSNKNSTTLYHQYMRTLHSFKYSVVEEWNKVPDSITLLSSDLSFQCCLKKLLLNFT